MFAVVVTLRIRPDAIEAFLPSITQNARASLMDEPGCLRFDVCTDSERPGEVLLYELYTDRAAFDAHLASMHFRAFDAEVAEMIVEKAVVTFDRVAS